MLAEALGPLFKLRRVHVDYRREDAPAELPRRAFRLKPGDPARSSEIRAAQIRLVDWFRARPSDGEPSSVLRVADVTVAAPGHIFVRGRGVNAELGGAP